MLTGTPCSLTISPKKIFAKDAAVWVALTGIKWAFLVCWSTIMHIPLFPFLVLGKPSMKSIDIISHFHYGTSKGCNKPTVFCWSPFTCWQIAHPLTKAAISFFMPFHQKTFFISLYIFEIPRWILGLERRLSNKTYCFKSLKCGTQILPLILKVPWSSISKLKHWSFLTLLMIPLNLLSNPCLLEILNFQKRWNNFQ